MNPFSEIASFFIKVSQKKFKSDFQGKLDRKFTLRNLFGALLLALLGYLGNYFYLPMFYGVDFLFGSIFTLIATYFYGLKIGVTVSAIASIYTIILWGQPYAAVLLILETIWVGIGLYYRRRRNQSPNMVLLVLSYWLCLGIPLCFFSYSFFLKFGISSVILVILKQVVNGAFNSLIAHLCIDYLPLGKWLQPIHTKQHRLTIQQVLFNLLLAFVCIPILIIATLTGHQSLNNIEREINHQLQSSTVNLASDLKIWHRRDLLALQQLADIAMDDRNWERLQFATTALTQVTPTFSRIYVTDRQGNVLSDFPIISNSERADLSTYIANNEIFQIARSSLSVAFSDIYNDSSSSSTNHIDVAVPVIKDNRFHGLVIGQLELSQIKRLLVEDAIAWNIDAFLLDRHNKIISSSSPANKVGSVFDWQQGGYIRPFRAGQMQWLPKMKAASMIRWRNSYYFQQTKIDDQNPWTLVMRLSPVSYINALETLYTHILAIVLGIILLATTVANLLSRRLIKPIAKLIRLTTDLQQKLADQSNFVWESKSFEEIDTLGDNFQDMAIALRNKFQEISQANLTLEERVMERSAELFKSEERWQLAIHAADDGIWDWNIETGITFRSERWYSMLGFNPATESEKEIDWASLVHPDDRDRLLKAQEDYLTHKAPSYIAEYRMRSQDGSYKWILTRALAIWNDEGKAIRLVGANSDITDLKIAKMEMLQAMESAQAASQAKSEFLATMSHEIRTPMNAIIGFTSLLLDSPLNSEQQEFIEIIRSSSNNLLTIINDILDFSKIEAGQVNLEIQSFNLRNCIEDCLEMFASLAISKQIELAYCMDADVPEWIVSDITRLRQILINLFSNAVKFTAQGEVTMRVSLLPTIGRTSHQLRFAVKDTGIGIPQESYNRLFKPFSQVDSSTTRQYGGTGLGLAIANRLTQLLGGEMSVASEVGVGSIFTFTIATTVPETIAISNQPQNLICARKRLLVLEDNEINRENLIVFAQSLAMEVMATDSTEQAIAWLQSGQQFDLAIVDACIPIANKPQESCGDCQIRELMRAKTSTLPMILMTLRCQGFVKVDDPITSYLPKPYKRSQLYKALLKLCSLHLLIESPPKQKDDHGFDENFAAKFPLKILLAEDNIVNQKVATRFLNRLGYHIDVVMNGIEVIDSISHQIYDVILMDVFMPEMDGIMATKQIVAEFEHRPWIIALTANALHDDRNICIQAGMQDYLSKPLQIHDLTQSLERAYRNKVNHKNEVL